MWYYRTDPSDNSVKPEPVLVIGSDATTSNIHYCPVSISSEPEKYDVVIEAEKARAIGIAKTLIIKTARIRLTMPAYKQKKAVAPLWCNRFPYKTSRRMF